MFKLILIVAPLVACVLAAPPLGSEAQLTQYASASDENGYGFQYVLSDGTNFSEEGKGAEAVRGSFGYTSPEGIPITVNYVADAEGFHPQSDVLPTPHPIPEAILRSIRYNQEHPTAEELADREVRKTQL